VKSELYGLASSTLGNLKPNMNLERRNKPRISEPVSVMVRGSDGQGRTYRFKTIARNIGSGGLCATAPRIMKAGEEITLRVRFALAGSNPTQAPAITARAVVLRVEEQFNESCVFAASFLLHRFI
jgi:c-di-GMP-binding flagellar brake protein YcgR